MTHPATAAVRHGSLLARHKLAFVLEIAGNSFGEYGAASLSTTWSLRVL